MASLFELIKQCIKHIFVHSEEKYLLYYIFIKNILLTEDLFMKTFYVKKFIELFYKNDHNYVSFILNKEYFKLKDYLDPEYGNKNEIALKDETIKLNYNFDHVQKQNYAIPKEKNNFIMLWDENYKCSNNVMNKNYFEFINIHLFEKEELCQLFFFNEFIEKKDDNIFLNYKIINFYKQKDIVINISEEEKKKKKITKIWFI